jgi:hypothetical protein
MSLESIQSRRVRRGIWSGADRIPARAGTTNQIEVIAGMWHFREAVVFLNPAHNLLQYDEFGQAAYTTPVL